MCSARCIITLLSSYPNNVFHLCLGGKLTGGLHVGTLNEHALFINGKIAGAESPYKRGGGLARINKMTVSVESASLLAIKNPPLIKS